MQALPKTIADQAGRQSTATNVGAQGVDTTRKGLIPTHESLPSTTTYP